MSDSAVLLHDLRPELRPGEWVFVTAAEPPGGATALASFELLHRLDPG